MNLGPLGYEPQLLEIKEPFNFNRLWDKLLITQMDSSFLIGVQRIETALDVPIIAFTG